MPLQSAYGYPQNSHMIFNSSVYQKGKYARGNWIICEQFEAAHKPLPEPIIGDSVI
jgi:hypothetical protein